MFHAAVMLLMIGSSITAAACCLLAGRVAPGAVPWQARQSAVVMAPGMVALCAGAGDARLLLMVAVCGIASAMIGVVGTRGRAHAAACFHRALGCLVMAVCALAMLGGSFRPATAGAPHGHAGHGVLVPMSLVAAVGVAALLALMLAGRVRRAADVPRVVSATAATRASREVVPGLHVVARAAIAHRGTGAGRILLETEGIAMAASLILMAAMVLAF